MPSYYRWGLAYHDNSAGTLIHISTIIEDDSDWFYQNLICWRERQMCWHLSSSSDYLFNWYKTSPLSTPGTSTYDASCYANMFFAEDKRFCIYQANEICKSTNFRYLICFPHPWWHHRLGWKGHRDSRIDPDIYCSRIHSSPDQYHYFPLPLAELQVWYSDPSHSPPRAAYYCYFPLPDVNLDHSGNY